MVNSHSHLETSWAPVHKLDRAFGLDVGNGSVHIFGYNITTIQHTTSHVLAVTGIALHHLIGWLKAGSGNFSNRQLLVISLLSRDDWRVGDQGEVYSGIRHQVGLKLRQIHVQGPIKTQGGSDRGHDLANEPVEVGVCGALDVKVSAANIVDGLIVNHEGTVGVLQSGVGGQD